MYKGDSFANLKTSAKGKGAVGTRWGKDSLVGTIFVFSLYLVGASTGGYILAISVYLARDDENALPLCLWPC